MFRVKINNIFHFSVDADRELGLYKSICLGQYVLLVYRKDQQYISTTFESSGIGKKNIFDKNVNKSGILKC